MDSTELRAAIKALPDHYMEGYECEWGCRDRFEAPPKYPREHPDCGPDEKAHSDDLISRREVLDLVSQWMMEGEV